MSTLELPAVGDKLADVIRTLSKVTWTNPYIRGELLVTPAHLDLLKSLSDDVQAAVGLVDPQGITREIEELTAGETYKVSIATGNPAVSNYLYWDLDHLLSVPSNQSALPDFYLLAKLDFRSWQPGPTPPEPIQNYLDAVEFASLLKHAAPFQHRNGIFDCVVFMVLGEPIEVPIKYDPGDLRPLTQLSNLRQELLEKAYANTRKDLLQKAVVQIAGSTGSDRAFAHLLSHFEALYRNFRSNLRLFEQGFAFETQKERLESDKRQLMGQAHAVITDTQSKLLAIPASLLLVGSQLKATGETQSPWYTGNLVVLLASVAVTVLMRLLTNFQRRQINAVTDEVRARRERWEKEAPDLAEDTSQAFQELDNSANTVRTAITTVWCVTVIVQAIAVVLFVYYAEPLRAIVVGFISQLATLWADNP